MKLCPICDREVKGSWCKNCKKFVKPYELSKSAHINTSHDESNDPNCDYHGTATGEYSTLPNGSGASVPSRSSNASGSSSGMRSAKKPNKRFFSLLVTWVFLMLGLIVAVGIFNSAKKEKKKINTTVYVTVIPAPPSFSISDGTKAWSLFCEEMNIPEMSGLFPIKEKLPEDEDDYFTDYYFDIDELKEYGIPCKSVECHLDVTYNEMKQLYSDSFPQFYVEKDETPEILNYMMTHDFYASTYFESQALFQLGDSDVMVDYDTSSGQLHGVSFYPNSSWKETAEGTVLLLEAVGDRSFTVSAMNEALETVQSQMIEEAKEDEDVLYNQKLLYKKVYEGNGILCEMRLIYLNAEDPEGKFSLEDTIPIWTLDITGTR